MPRRRIHVTGASGYLGTELLRLAPDHRAFDVLEDLVIVLVLVMVRVDVDDQEVLIVALARLLGSVLEMLRRREQVEFDGPDIVTGHIHGCSP